MGTTLLMSYPGPDWHIRGGENFRSRARSATSPRRAMQEWLGLCDRIVHAGGHILVMPPPSVQPPLTGMVFTANAGQLFHLPDRWVYLVSRMAVEHRRGEREHVSAFLGDAGLTVMHARQPWEGQADLQQ